MRGVVMEKTWLYVDTVEEMLNIYGSVWGEKCALKRQRRLWCLVSDLFYPGGFFSCECADCWAWNGRNWMSHMSNTYIYQKNRNKALCFILTRWFLVIRNIACLYTLFQYIVFQLKFAPSKISDFNQVWKKNAETGLF